MNALSSPLCYVQLSLWLVAGFPLASISNGQVVTSYGAAGSLYSQNFDGMVLSGSPTAAAMPAGWRVGTNTTPGGTSATVQYYNTTTGVIANSAGASVAGGSWVFTTTNGSTPSNDLSLGSFTGAADRITQLALSNDTASTLTQFTISYTGEQWLRLTSSDTLRFRYQIGSQTGEWIYAGTAFNFVTPQVGPTMNLNGTAAGNFIDNIGGTVSGITWAPGTNLYLQWFDLSSVDTIIAIDNVSFSAVPEPSTWVMAGLGLAFALRLARRRGTMM